MRRLHALARELEVAFDRLAIVVNRRRQASLPAEVEKIRADTGAQFVLALPDNAAAASIAERGGAIAELPPDNDLVRRVDDFLNKVLG